MSLLRNTRSTLPNLAPITSSEWDLKRLLIRTCMKNRMCNQWDNWRAYGPELLLWNQLITDPTYNKTCWTDVWIYAFSAVDDISLYYVVSLAIELGNQVSFGAEPRAGFDLSLLKRSNINWMIGQWNFEWDQYDEALRTKYFINSF